MPPPKVQDVLYLSIVLLLHLAPLKMSIHLNIFLVGDCHIIFYIFRQDYFIYWSIQGTWSETWSFLADQQFQILNIITFFLVDLRNSSHRPTVSGYICLNQNNIIYFEIPLFSGPYWSCLKRGQEFFLHLDQKSSSKCFTLPHRLLLYKSGLTYEPGEGIFILLFAVNRLFGDKEVRLCGSLICFHR